MTNSPNKEQLNQLLRFAIGGYWSALEPKLYKYEVSSEVKKLLQEQLNLQEQFQKERTLEEIVNRANPHTIADYMRTKKENEQLTQELATERETTQQALQTSQEWHERQKAEIIEQWKEKLITYRNQRKTSLQAEINLIKEVLNE